MYGEKIFFCNLAQVFDAISQIVFLLVLILIAKGYTVTRGQLKKLTFMKLCIFFSIYLFAYVSAFVCASIVSADYSNDLIRKWKFNSF